MKQSKHVAAARKAAFQALTYPGGAIRPVKPRFWELYSQLPYGAARREALLAFLRQARDEGGCSYIPVNKRYQASLADPDLRYMLKKGLLVRSRDFGGYRHPMNKTTRARQTMLHLLPD